MSTSAALQKQAEATLYPVTCRLICAVSRPRFFTEFLVAVQTGF
ncbi:hypothetical protein [Neisseria elongata]|nr:hypothetical protein [Neisseria elongata]